MEPGWEKVDRKRTGGANVRLLDEFLAGDADCIAKEMGDERKATSRRNSLMQTIKTYERFSCIKASKRGTTVYLIRSQEDTANDP